MRLGIAVCIVRAGKYCVESVPIVLKISCFSQGEMSAVQLPLDGTFTLLHSKIIRAATIYCMSLCYDIK